MERKISEPPDQAMAERPNRPVARPTRWLRGLGMGLGAWLVIATGLWTLRGPTTGDAIATAVAAALLMALVVSWIAGRFGSASAHWLITVGVHAFVALLFGSLMVALTYSVQASALGTTLREEMSGARFLGAEFVFWTWLYVVFAWGAHGLRIREDLRNERERIARSEAHLAEARLAALQGQLNPHFLFNALHTVSSLVRDDPERAAEALALLGDLLRYTIDDAEARLVSLEEELAFTRSYLELAQMVMGDRLSVEWSLDVDGTAAVPPLFLQVLVENAVRHGVQPLPEGGRVTIRVEAEAGRLGIRVENDQPVHVKSNQEKPTSSMEGAERTTGSGLANLRTRLETLYGKDALLAAASGPDGRFVASVEIPS